MLPHSPSSTDLTESSSTTPTPTSAGGLARGRQAPPVSERVRVAGGQYSQLSYVGPGLHAQQLLAVANIGGSTITPGLWAKWTTPLDGSEEESWTDGGAGLAEQLSAWPTKLANASWSEAHGKLALLHSLNGTETGNTYGLGSMLLIAAGDSSYSTSNTPTRLRKRCGIPSTRPRSSWAGRRGPTRGSPTASTSACSPTGSCWSTRRADSIPSFSLGGGIYSGSQLNNVTSVSMGPTSGLILLRVG